MQVYKCNRCGAEVRGLSHLYREICLCCEKGILEITGEWWDFTSPYDRRVTVIERPEHEENDEGVTEIPPEKS